MTNQLIKTLWDQGLTVEDYFYLLDLTGQGILTVPYGLVDLDKLRNKGYLDKYNPTDKATILINQSLSGESLEISFREFWNAYPEDVTALRELRHSYTESLELYAKALEDLGPDELLNALKAEIAFRKGSPSKFKFMKGITSYLSSKEYLNLKKVNLPQLSYGKAVS
jgi:hypothetical protein